MRTRSSCSWSARALISPIDWEEPFGLMMIEAMACGTPVISTRRGAVPEIVDHGRTGVIVDRLSRHGGSAPCSSSPTRSIPS